MPIWLGVLELHRHECRHKTDLRSTELNRGKGGRRVGPRGTDAQAGIISPNQCAFLFSTSELVFF